MAITGGPTVTLTFKGDTEDLKRQIAGIGTMVAGVSATVGVLGGIGAAAGAVSLAVAAVPLAFLGIGIAAAAQSQMVKDRFTELKDHVMGEMTHMTASILGELLIAADRLTAWFDRLAPQFEALFKLSAPYLQIFLDGIMALVERALPGFQVALEKGVPIAEAFSRGLGAIGEGLGGFFAALTEGTPGATVAIDALFGLVRDLLIYLGQLVAQLANALGPAFAAMVGPVMDLVRAIGDALIPIISALAPLLGPLADLIGQVLTLALGALSTALTPVVQALVNALQPVIPVISDSLARMSPIIMDVAAKMGVSLAEAVTALAPLLLELVTQCLRLIEALLPLIPPLVEIGRNALPLIAGVTKDVVIPALTWLVDMIIQHVVPALKTWLDEMARLSEGLRTAWDMIKAIFTGNINDLTAATNAGGRSVMQGFLDGVVAMSGPTGIGVKTALQAVRDLFPSSPAKEGPFSGSGYTYESGVAMMEDFAKGIMAAAPALYEKMAGIVGDLQGMTAAAGELAKHIASGGGVFEDFSFQGMSANMGKWNDTFAKIAGSGGAGLISALGEVVGQMGRGGQVFEDFSFRGMSANLAKYNDQLSKMFTFGRGAGGALELKIAPGADSALSSMLMNLVRTGQLQLAKV